jgi:hypothetical protein
MEIDFGDMDLDNGTVITKAYTVSHYSRVKDFIKKNYS